MYFTDKDYLNNIHREIARPGQLCIYNQINRVNLKTINYNNENSVNLRDFILLVGIMGLSEYHNNKNMHSDNQYISVCTFFLKSQ